MKSTIREQITNNKIANVYMGLSCNEFKRCLETAITKGLADSTIYEAKNNSMALKRILSNAVGFELDVPKRKGRKKKE